MLAVYRTFHALVFALYRLFSPLFPKARRGLRGRQDLANRVGRLAFPSRPYWFHFASSGEFEQAIPILEALKAREPTIPIFLSHFSVTGARAVELEKQRRLNAGVAIPWDAVDFSPWDFPWTVNAFLKALKPRALVVLNREFWPELFEGCYQRHIPVYLFAAFFSEKARRFFPFYQGFLDRAAFLGTVDSSTAAFLKTALPRRSIQAIGDPRIERVLERKKLAREEHFFDLDDAPVFVGASIWMEDFRALQPSLDALLTASQPWTIVLVPHELDPGLILFLSEWAQSRAVPWRLWSEEPATPAPPKILLIDSVGWLAELYRIARLAFVGGSFRAKVHNVLEPAAYGVPILTGPFIQNSIEAQEMVQTGALFAAANRAALLAKVRTYLKDDELRKVSGQRALEFLEERTGAGARYADLLAGVPLHS